MLVQPSPEHPGSLGTRGAIQADRSQGVTPVAQPGSMAALPYGDPESQDLSPGSDASADPVLVTIEEVQKSLSRSRASVYRYTNTDPRNLNPPFNPRKLNPEFRSDQKEPLLFHPHEVARFARDVLRIKDVKVEVLNSPSTATQQLLVAILEELRAIRTQLASPEVASPNHVSPRQLHNQSRPAA